MNFVYGVPRLIDDDDDDVVTMAGAGSSLKFLLTGVPDYDFTTVTFRLEVPTGRII